MSYDQYLEAFYNGAGGKEQTALAIYYLGEVEGKTSVSQSDVRSIIQQSRSTISPSGISRYISRLQRDNLVTSVGNGGYRLTRDGIDAIEGGLDDAALVSTRNEEDRFIDTDEFDGDGRYEMLVDDINECYQYRIYDATMVLTRKLFEDMTFKILQLHFAGRDDRMFYDQENSRHYTFGELLNNLSEAVPTLRRYSRELDRGLVEGVRNLKNDGNTGAHAIRVDFTDEEVESWSGRATRWAEVLYDVLNGARIGRGEE